MPFSLLRRSLLTLSIIAVTLGATFPAGPAKADPTQLCRSVASIALAPTDLILAPIITAKDMHYGLTEWDDSIWLQVIGIVPGYVYLNAMQLGGTAIRVIGAIFEFPVGFFTLFREGAQRPLFASQDDAWGLISTNIGYCPIRIGLSYNSINL